ncbi:hypothetical protein [Andreprevotia chitinilytica]|uniref:hypothetical protein n=1 Tax=Andreprevotia chitinilytica TaxID=396808 RepID=UPI000558A49C|nr:hypothetical protein [Andreprevotia chitinilytica]
MTPVNKRTRFIAALKALPVHMQERLQALKADGEALRQRPDLLWYLLLQCAATRENARYWAGLCDAPELLHSVSYAILTQLDAASRAAHLLSVLRKAKIRLRGEQTVQLAVNVSRITELGGVEAATTHMLNLPTRDEKYEFMCSFHGIGPKYARKVWMDIHDPAFRDTFAVDLRLKRVAVALGFSDCREGSYQQAELFYHAIAQEAALEPWELDRLLYHFTNHFLGEIEGRPWVARGLGTSRHIERTT